MKEKILGLVIASDNIKKISYIHEDLYKEISKKFNKFYIINFYYLKFFNNKKKRIINGNFPKNFKVFTPKTKNELYNFFLNKEMIAFNALGKNIEYFNILFLIKKIDIKLMLLQNAGDIGNSGEIKKKNIITYTFRFSYILNYLIFRFLVFLDIFSTIELYFECRKSIVKNCQKNTYLKRIENIFPYFKFYYFRKTILINSRSYDELIQNKKKISEKNIIFLDSGFFHKDRTIREGKISKEDAVRYFFLLKIFLINLSKLYKKKVIICLHPSSNYKIYSNYLKKFKITKYKTIEYINKSFLVIFHESSSVFNAIFLKKKIISIYSKTMGSYLNEKIRTYKEKIGLYSYNLDNQNSLKSKKLLIDLNRRKYTKYVKENINPDGNIPGKIKIINEINKNFFLN